MFVDSERPDGFRERCTVCGKEGIIMPSFPSNDGCCPHCGSLIVCSPIPSSARNKHIGYGVLPDTEKNREEAERVVKETTKAWEQFRKVIQ